MEESVFVGKTELIEAQMSDPDISLVREWVVSQMRPNREGWKRLTGDGRILMRSFRKLKIMDEVLVRQTAKFQHVVLPKKY